MSISRDPASATVENAGTTSTSFELQATRGCFQLPSGFTGTNCTVQGSIDNTTFTNVAIEGNETAPMVVASSGTYSFPVKAMNYKYLRFLVDAQTGAKTIALWTRDN